MTATQLNPYQSPGLEVDFSPPPFDGPITFGGSITVEEAIQIDGLLKPAGKPGQQPKQPKGMLAFGTLALVGVLALGVDAYLHDELDQLHDFGLGIAITGVVLYATVFAPKQRLRKLAKMRAAAKGLFTSLRGEVTEVGARFYAAEEEIPLDYGWNDYVGYRSSDDAVLLYVSYPRDVNPLGRSCFASENDFLAARELISSRLQPIPAYVRSARYKAKPGQASLMKGSQLLAAGKWKRAAAAFEELLRIDQHNAHGLRGHASATCMLGDFAAAITSAERLLEGWPNDLATRRLYTTILLGLERYEQAVSNLNALLEEHPEDMDLLASRSRGLVELGRFEESMQDADRMLALDPTYAIGHNNRGRCLIELGRPHEAIPFLEKAIKLAPKIPNPRQHLKRAQELVGGS